MRKFEILEQAALDFGGAKFEITPVFEINVRRVKNNSLRYFINNETEIDRTTALQIISRHIEETED